MNYEIWFHNIHSFMKKNTKDFLTKMLLLFGRLLYIRGTIKFKWIMSVLLIASHFYEAIWINDLVLTIYSVKLIIAFSPAWYYWLWHFKDSYFFMSPSFFNYSFIIYFSKTLKFLSMNFYYPYLLEILILINLFQALLNLFKRC